jgi:hypothetical protein
MWCGGDSHRQNKIEGKIKPLKKIPKFFQKTIDKVK